MQSFTALLTTLFIALKLTGYTDWSWWLVLSPLPMYIVSYVGIVLLLAIAKAKEEIKIEKMRKKYV